jgi:thiamine-phosphate pyrophosphorylase
MPQLEFEQQLYLITRSPFSKADWHTIEAAICGGVGIVQLRDKEARDDELMAISESLLSLLEPYNVPLVINDRLAVARATGAHLHLGLNDGCPIHAREVLGPDAIIGLTIHQWPQLAEKYKDVINYVGCGPVFNTETKADALASFGVETLKGLCKDSPVPVVAIGGISEDNIHSVWAAKPFAVAVCSAIFNSSSPQKSAEMLRPNRH